MFAGKKTKESKSNPRRTQNAQVLTATARRPRASRDGVQRENSYALPKLGLFWRRGVCRNLPRTALAINSIARRQAAQTKLNNASLYAPCYEDEFLPKVKKRPYQNAEGEEHSWVSPVSSFVFFGCYPPVRNDIAAVFVVAAIVAAGTLLVMLRSDAAAVLGAGAINHIACFTTGMAACC